MREIPVPPEFFERLEDGEEAESMLLYDEATDEYVYDDGSIAEVRPLEAHRRPVLATA